MGFDAGKAVEPLDWDFSKFDLGKGTIPEPSERAVTIFSAKFRRLMSVILEEGRKRQRQTLADLKAEEEKSRAATQEEEEEQDLTLLEALAAMEGSDVQDVDIEKVSETMAEMVAELSEGNPDKETIMQLPSRIRAAFFAWLVRELFSPEANAVGTKPSLALVSGGLSGITRAGT